MGVIKDDRSAVARSAELVERFVAGVDVVGIERSITLPEIWEIVPRVAACEAEAGRMMCVFFLWAICILDESLSSGCGSIGVGWDAF